MSGNPPKPTSGGETTGKALSPTSPSIPRWIVILSALALDKRQDLPEELIGLWRVKLKSFPAREIEKALLAYQGQFFPSVDEVIGLIEASRRAVTASRSREFAACGKDGCVSGWRPVSAEKFARWQRCACLNERQN